MILISFEALSNLVTTMIPKKKKKTNPENDIKTLSHVPNTQKMREPGFKTTVLPAQAVPCFRGQGRGVGKWNDGADGPLGSLCLFLSGKLYLSLFCRMGSYLRYP